MTIDARYEVDPNAIRVGERVVKCNARPEEAIQDGAAGTVRQRLGPSAEGVVEAETDAEGFARVTAADRYGYFVVWDDQPGIPSFIAGSRIRRPEKP